MDKNMVCPKCGSEMKKDGDNMKCVKCGHTVPAKEENKEMKKGM